MKKALIIGMGISGKSAANFLQENGWEISAFDDRYNQDASSINLNEFEIVVVSPGIAKSHLLYKKAIEMEMVITSEAELAFQNMKNPCIGITGTKGKSTTVSLVSHVLTKSGKKATALGNIGVPLLSSLKNLEDDEIVVAELSSFQLEPVESRCFDIAAFISFSQDHLDRYESLESYFLTKKKLFDLKKEGAPFFVHQSVYDQYPHFFNKEACVIIKDDENLMQKIKEPLKFQKTACLFAYHITRYLGVSEEAFFEALVTFNGLPHRLEYVGDVRGVRCYNDSKATNPEAVTHAVCQIGADIVLLAGGRHKSGGFEKWREVFPKKVKHLILFGESKGFIARELGEEVSFELVDSMQEAVKRGLQVAIKSDTLLLSPGCASFDAFINFEERGDTFRRMIKDESKRYDFNCCIN